MSYHAVSLGYEKETNILQGQDATAITWELQTLKLRKNIEMVTND
jgi:hypothetical protein